MHLERKISLAEGIGIVAGGVVGMGIYVLIASISEKSGSAGWLAISIALFISLIGVTPLIQISSALPIAGGGYYYCSRLINPLFGTLVSYWALLGGAASTCVVAVGFGGYLKTFLPFEVPTHLLAIILISLFYIFYLFGIKVVTTLQLILSLQFILALLFYIFGAGASTTLTMQFSLDGESTGFIMAIILAFNVCIGFQIITELGEEMKDARKNIPLALISGAGIVLLIYIGVSIVYVSIVGDDLAEYKLLDAPLIESARGKLSDGVLAFLSLGAISAGLTSFNAAAIALPREIYSQARDQIIPSYFEKINARTKTPLRAVTIFFIFVIFLLSFGGSIDFYGYMAACGIMLLTIFVSIGALRLRELFPEQYKAAYIRIPPFILKIFVMASILSSAGLVILLFMESVLIFAIYSIFTVLIGIYYYYRSRWLRDKNIEFGSSLVE